jgi:hypothetical protein
MRWRVVYRTKAHRACDNLPMPFSRIAENRIQEAIASGEFENLPGAGEPLDVNPGNHLTDVVGEQSIRGRRSVTTSSQVISDLEEYFSTPGDVRIAFSILKTANCVPAEVELLNEISRLEQADRQTTDPAARRSLRQTLANRRLELAIALERKARR